MQTQYKLSTDIGTIYLVATEKGLSGLHWTKQAVPMGETALLKMAAKEVAEYLAGERTQFSVPLDLQGTAFQKKVWNELLKIPFGETASYKDIARKLKNVNAVRAVGGANGKNPVSIIVPCHRVISSDGTLGGYAGGLKIKTKLLALEKK